jgi:DNA-binding response OmpR family regulator
MYEAFLTGHGYETIIVNNGRDAYDYIINHRPALAMLDLSMPDMSGLAILQALAANHFDLSKMPVIILTNSNEDADREMARKFHAEYIIKADLSPAQVLERINQLLVRQ